MQWSVLPSADAVQMPRFVSPSCVCSPIHTSRCARIRVVFGRLASSFWCYAPVVDSGTMLAVSSPLGWCALCSCAGRWWCVQVAGRRLGFPPWQIFRQQLQSTAQDCLAPVESRGHFLASPRLPRSAESLFRAGLGVFQEALCLTTGTSLAFENPISLKNRPRSALRPRH